MIGESKQLIILTLIAVIASGCASTTNTQDSTSSTGPISVNSFEGIPNPASADRTVNINLELENTGDADAETVAARIFGPTFANSNTDTQAWRDSSGGEVDAEERTLSFGELRAPGDNTPSVPMRQGISLTAPSLSQDREVDYNFQSKIFYEYETTGSTDFTLVSGERFQEENMQRTEAELDSSSGPIQLDIRGTTPKIFYRDDNVEGVESEVCIQATNEGGGKAFLGGQEDAGDRIWSENADNYQENVIDLEIQDISNVRFEARDTGENSAQVELVGGEEGFQCYTMIAEDLGGTEEQTINTQITAEYNYIKEDQTTVTVEGRRTSGTTTPPGDDGEEETTEDEDEETGETSDDSEGDDTDSVQYNYLGTEGDLTWEAAEGDTANEVCQDLEERANAGNIPESQYTDNCEVIE